MGFVIKTAGNTSVNAIILWVQFYTLQQFKHMSYIFDHQTIV